MTNPETADQNQPGGQFGDWMTLSREQARAVTEWTQTGRVRLRRQVVTETRSVEVTVRREVLVVDGTDLTHDTSTGLERVAGTRYDGPAVAAPAAPADTVSILLREEVPEIVLHTRPYERVTASFVPVALQQELHGTVRHEEVAFDGPADGRTTPGAPTPGV